MTRPTCHRCHAPVIAGVDSNALDVRLDPTRLSVIGEALAVIAGRKTWAVTVSRRHGRDIDRRDRWSIGTPPGPAGSLHVAHDCAAQVPAAWRAPDPTPAHRPDPEEVPF